MAIEESLHDPEFKASDVLIPFYTRFLSSFAQKLNPLRLAHIAVAVAEQYKEPKDAGRQAAPWHCRIPHLSAPCLKLSGSVVHCHRLCQGSHNVHQSPLAEA